MSVRVRFAPSPTGKLHVGALRDALFKHLFARHHNGANILRIEDTDRTRYSAESEQEFIDSLRWVGIEYDEGPHVGGPHAPYRQSERKAEGIYAREIEKLLAAGHAYKAFDTTEELEAMRKTQELNRQQVGYFGGSWRDATPEQVAQAEASGKLYVIRQRIPRNTTIVVDDAIRGRIEWDSNTVDDPVLIKADGMPTYHFAAMVDDHLMEITHIIRGEEWVSSAPKHAALFDAFGWERPVFVHCAVIKGPDGKKLSKRHGATRVLDYRAQGFLPDALKNFVALIGWSPGGDRELMTEQELISAFDLDGLQPSPGLFDMEKLKWMNGNYIRARDPEILFSELLGYIRDPATARYFVQPDEDEDADTSISDPQGVWSSLALLDRAAAKDPGLVREVVKLERERVQTLADFGPASEFFFLDEPPMDDKAVAKWLHSTNVRELFDFLIARLSAPRVAVGGPVATNHASVEWCEAMVREYAAGKGLDKLGPVVHPTRVALTGKTTGPGLFELMSVLGPERMIRRLERAKSFVPEF